MLRLLHTADWHLGHTLEGISREQDHARFLAWLATTLRERRIDALVIAGDVFDHAQPSADAQRQYFDFLRRVAKSAVRHIVVVGGNHDSAARLDAPRELLADFDVHVVGGLDASDSRWNDCVHSLRDDRGRVEASVLAVPYVHEYRLGIRTTHGSAGEIAEAFHARFGALYRRLCDHALATNGDAPLIATGHLALAATDQDDAPRAVHMVKHFGGISPTVFDERIAYVALGHIHRSHGVEARPIWYAGSPIALNARESAQPRRAIEVEVELGCPAVITPIEVPSFRSIVTVEGPVDYVADTIRALRWETDLAPIVYPVVVAERFTSAIEQRIRDASELLADKGVRVLRVRRKPLEATEASASAPMPSEVESLRTMTPEEVFLKLCAARKEQADDALMRAFRSVMQGDDAP